MSEPVVGERRPLATREQAWAKAIAARLAAAGVTPNAISILGMIAGMLAGAAFALTHDATWGRAWFVVAAALVQLRLACNMLDGMVAILARKASPVGELYNEVPDRISDAATLIGAGYAAGSNPALGYIAACLALFVAYIRAQGKAAGAKHEFCGPMAKPQRMFAITVAALYAALVPFAWQSYFIPYAYAISVGLVIIIAGSIVTAVRRLGRIADALRKEAP